MTSDECDRFWATIEHWDDEDWEAFSRLAKEAARYSRAAKLSRRQLPPDRVVTIGYNWRKTDRVLTARDCDRIAHHWFG